MGFDLGLSVNVVDNILDIVDLVDLVGLSLDDFLFLVDLLVVGHTGILVDVDVHFCDFGGFLMVVVVSLVVVVSVSVSLSF